MYGQTQENENNDGINVDVILGQASDLSDEEIAKLIEEFKAIMKIDENERTVEQWNRAIEILFIAYFNADLRKEFESLESEIAKYKTLNESLISMLNDLEEIYKKEQAVYNSLYDLQHNLSIIYENYLGITNKRSIQIFLDAGYTINFGMNINIGLTFPIGDFSLGGYTGLFTNFKDSTYFTVGVIFGWRF